MEDDTLHVLSGSLNQRFAGLAIGKSIAHPVHNFEETNSRLVVIGEINILLIALRQTYSFLNDLDSFRSRATGRNKSRFSSGSSVNTPAVTATDPDLEDEEEELWEAFQSGQLSTENQDSVLIVQYLNLKRLKARLTKNLNVLIDHSYLKPFCELIKKGNSGTIIGIALSSLLKFLNYGLIDYTEASGSAQLIGETLLEVRFSVTDSGNDEVVLMRILHLLREIVTRGFTAIKNETIVAMLKTCFKFPFETHFSKLLRKTAEHALIEMIRTIFMRLHEFDDKLVMRFTKRKADTFEVVANPSTNEMASDFVNQQGVKFAETSDSSPSLPSIVAPPTFYDIQCVYDIFEYITALLNPTQKQPQQDSFTTDLRVQVGLNLLIVIFETAVLSIGEKRCLMNVVQDDLCWNLLLLIQPERQLTVFWHALRLSTLIVTNLRMQLKYQFEMLLNRLMEIISTSSVAFDYREIAMDYLFSLEQQIPFFAQEIFINYDCDPYSNNLYESMIKLFSMICCHNSLAGGGGQMQHPTDVHTFAPLQQTALNSLLINLKSLQKAELINEIVVQRYLDHDAHQRFDCISPENDDNNESLVAADVDPIEATYRDNIRKQRFLERQHLVGLFVFPETIDELARLKDRKKLTAMAVDQFNAKPSKGITFLQEHQLITCDEDLVRFLRENLKLDKKNIGDFLSNRKNEEILTKFAFSFDFTGLRIDEALRNYLESFRLPGEAPLISNILEKFSLHWFLSNQKPFEHEDNAFTLSYAIIMLNTDQHNTNVRQSMTCDEFVHNLRGANNGKDFDQDMLRSIYATIRENKIVMPAEMHGIVKNRYLWKCMLRRSRTPLGLYWHATNRKTSTDATVDEQQPLSTFSMIERKVELGFLNRPIFMLLWRPTLESLSYLFEKIHVHQRSGLIRKILNQGFTSSAFLCARYGHLDDLIAALCKFTVNSAGGPLNQLQNQKSQEAAHCLFSITKEYANEIDGAWANVVEMLINWYRARFLDEIFEIEDFALGDKLIKMKRKLNPRLLQRNQMENSSNIFTSFYQFFSGNDLTKSDSDGPDSLNSDVADGERRSNSLSSIYSQPLHIIQDSKFFRHESLVGLVSALINVTINDDDEDDIEAFKLELLIQIILLNRDRVETLWKQISTYLERLLLLSQTSELLAERGISALFRLAIRFIPRKDALSEPILQLLSSLLKMNSKYVQKNYTAIGLHSFLAHCHAYLNKSQEWILLNDLLVFVGIGYKAKTIDQSASGSIEILNVQSDCEAGSLESDHHPNLNSIRGYTSDSEIETGSNRITSASHSVSATSGAPPPNPYELLSGKSVGLNRSSGFRIRDVVAYEKCVDCIEVLASEVIPRFSQMHLCDLDAQIVIEVCVKSIRKFAEASILLDWTTGSELHSLHRSTSHHGDTRRHRNAGPTRKMGTAGSAFDLHKITDSNSDPESEEPLLAHSEELRARLAHEQSVLRAQISTATESSALRLLQLIHDLQLTISASSEKNSAAGDAVEPFNTIEQLWTQLWCPLLQANALLCCDARKSVRSSAVACLQRALLNRDLQRLAAAQWENCFNSVLFPLLSRLLQPINMADSSGMDETRVRLTNLLSKLFLQHLNALHSLPTFVALWLTLLDYMDRYLRFELSSEMMREAIPESLKNMLLVMQTAKCLDEPLSSITWDRIDLFLPNLKAEIVPPTAPPPSLNGPTVDESNIHPNHSEAQVNSNTNATQFVTCHVTNVESTIDSMTATTVAATIMSAEQQSNDEPEIAQINATPCLSHSASPVHQVSSIDSNHHTVPLHDHQSAYSNVYQNLQSSLTTVVIGPNSHAPQQMYSNPTIYSYHQSHSQYVGHPQPQQQHTQLTQQPPHAHSMLPQHHHHPHHQVSPNYHPQHVAITAEQFPSMQITGDYRPPSIASQPHLSSISPSSPAPRLSSPSLETVSQPSPTSHLMSNLPTQQSSLLRHSAPMPEHLYQSLQQQTSFTPSLTSGSAYPWPAPGDPKYL